MAAKMLIKRILAILAANLVAILAANHKIIILKFRK